MRMPVKLAERIKDIYRNMNWVVFGTTVLLMVIGALAIYSATSTSTKPFLMKQVVWYVIGFIIMMIFANINYNNLISLANYLYAAFLIILVFVLFWGHESLGATRWIKIGGVQFQPSEFMKIIVSLAVIRFILVRQKEAFTWKNLAKIAVLVAVPLFLILAQPDLGSAILIIPLVLVVLFMGNISVKKLVIILIIGMLILPAGYLVLKDYQKQRIKVFLNPDIDPLGAGYNVIQSQIAVGSGRLTGKGWVQGTQSQLNFIPIKYTDFIFAVIAEEFGFLGGVAVTLIYFILIMEGLKIVKLCRYNGGKMLGGALSIIIFSQVTINIGMNIGIMPVTGITLPLLSYGGSSVLVIMIALGILQNIYREYMKVEEK